VAKKRKVIRDGPATTFKPDHGPKKPSESGPHVPLGPHVEKGRVTKKPDGVLSKTERPKKSGGALTQPHKHVEKTHVTRKSDRLSTTMRHTKPGGALTQRSKPSKAAHKPDAGLGGRAQPPKSPPKPPDD
jgi:hypothetical protein